MLIHVVINPRSARCPGASLEAILREEFPGDTVRISSCPPREPGSCGAVIAAGGDGTVHRLLEELAGGPVPLGVLPCGRGNDLARALGMPGDLRAACAALRRGSPGAIDLISVNGRRFATCGGLGLVAAVAARADTWRRGSAASARLARSALVYPAAFCREVAGGYRAVSARILLPAADTGGIGGGSGGDGRPASFAPGGPVLEGRFAAIVVGNQPRLGGRFSVCSRADNRDGLLDLCAIRAPRSRAGMLALGVRALRGRLVEGRGVRRATAAEIRILTDEDVLFSGDGEPVAWGREFRIRVERAALPVIVPAPRTFRPRPPEVGHAA